MVKIIEYIEKGGGTKMLTLIFLIMLLIFGIKLVSRAFKLFDRWLDVEEERMFTKKKHAHRRHSVDDEFDI